MKAYQCDRCFRYYTENKDVIPRGLQSNAVAKTITITCKNEAHKTYELCDECLRRINDFLNYVGEDDQRI